MSEEVDLYALDLNELKRLAMELPSDEAAEQVAEEQLRDERGRFTKPESEPGPDVEAAEEAEQQADPTPTRFVVSRVIGDERFEASGASKEEALEALADKMAEAKLHATKKIREQETLLRKQKETEQQVGEDEEYIYSQELMNKPTEAYKKLFKRTTGIDVEEFKQLHNFVNAQSMSAITTNFFTTHPLFEDTTKNGEVMRMYLNANSLPITADNLEKAYSDLSAKGLLDLKSEQASSVQEKKEPSTQRIAEPEPKALPQGTKKASGLSTRNRNAAPPVNTTLSEDDLYSLPLEKLIELDRKGS